MCGGVGVGLRTGEGDLFSLQKGFGGVTTWKWKMRGGNKVLDGLMDWEGGGVIMGVFDERDNIPV